MSPLPLAANSGQYDATVASGSSVPRSISRFTHVAVTPFVEENTGTIVSSRQRPPPVASARPPQTSTTGRPSTYTQHAAPTSPCSSKFTANASRTTSKSGSTTPSMPVTRPSGGHGEAAVDDERLAGDELRVVAREEHGGTGEVFGLERALHRRHRGHALDEHVGDDLLRRLRHRHPGRDAVDGDVVLAELRGHELRQAD